MTEPIFIGIDGEGRGRIVHHYVMMAAADDTGKYKWVTPEVNESLPTRTCLEFLFSLPDNARIYSYGFNYDLTKMLHDLSDNKIYELFRPELRQRKPGAKQGPPYAVLWEDYRLNLQGTKFWVTKGKKRRVIWDVIKFYQSTFVNALKAWKVGDKEILDKIQSMKDKRSEFDLLDRQSILDYCHLECQYLAQLVKKLISAHDAVGLKLTKFHGAGTTASLILDKMNIRQCKRDTPIEMKQAVSQAFFGGRFEHSVIGPIEPDIFSHDISSAYPYQCRFLPCLDHGSWELTKSRKELENPNIKAALVHYKLNPKIVSDISSWAPFPHRDSSGSICYPSKSGGGWIWKDEYLAGESLFNYVRFVEAWTYKSNCACVPFRAIPQFYKERVRIGKEGPGIVLKLGPNGTYGKLAQSIGHNPPYQCWIWAGMITSGCRAQILQLMSLHKNLNNILAIATDGVYTKEDIVTPIPLDTGTFEDNLIDEHGNHVNKPLGGWESKKTKGAVFFARPGIYFESGLTIGAMKDIVRARGIGRAELVRYAARFVEAWKNGEPGFTLPKQIDRFCGAKTSTHRSSAGTSRADYYGQWVKRPVTLTFDPMPKRNRDIIRLPNKEYGLLTVREVKGESEPYSRALHSNTPDAQDLKRHALEMLEQPNAEYIMYEGYENT